MRISCLATSCHIGGAERVLLDLIRGLRVERPSWSVQVVVPGQGALLEACGALDVQCAVVEMPGTFARTGESAFDRRVPPGRDASKRASARLVAGVRLGLAATAVPSYVRRLRAAVAAFSPDVVHTNGIKAHVLGARVAGGTPVLWHLHEYIGWRPFTRRLLQAQRDAAGMVIAVSRSVAEDAAAVLGRPAGLIENAVDLDRFQPGGRALPLDEVSGLAAAEDGIRVGLLGTLSRWKGHELFLEAVARLPHGMHVRGYVIGDAIYSSSGSQATITTLRRRAADLGLADRVGFTGLQPAPDALRALDIAVHASTGREPFGLAVAEAMACGRAVVSTAEGGAADLIEDGRTGIVSAASPAALAEAIARCAASADLRQRLGRAARRHAEARFGIPRLVREFITAYEDLVASRASGPRRTVA